MTGHVSDELPRLLTGEATRELVLNAAAHLRDCVDCQQELVLAVVAHASLTSAQRFAPEIVIGPPERTTTGEHAAPADDLPDLSTMFAKVHGEAASTLRRPDSHSRRVRYGLVAAAAAVVVGGGATAIAIANSGDSSNPGSHTVPARTVALQAFDKGTTPANVTVHSGGQMTIDAASLPNLASRHYEVWLTNAGRTDLQPIGWLNVNGTATLTVPSNLMKRFTDIEVSVQDVASANYTYSGTSVLRGAYA